MLRPHLVQAGRTTSDPEQVRRQLATSSTVAATVALGMFVDEVASDAYDGSDAMGQQDEAAVPLVPLDLLLDDRTWDELVRPAPRPAPPMTSRSLTAPLPSRPRPPPSPRNFRRPFAFPTPDPVDDDAAEPRRREETVTLLSLPQAGTSAVVTKVALARRSVVKWEFGDLASPTTPEHSSPVAGPSLLRPREQPTVKADAEEDDELFKTPTPESVSQFASALPDGDSDEAQPAVFERKLEGALESAARPLQATATGGNIWAFHQPPLAPLPSSPSSPVVARRPIPRPRTSPSPVAVPSALPNEDEDNISPDENDTLVWSTPSPTGLIGDAARSSLPDLSGGFVRRRGTGPSPPSPPESEDSPRTPLHLELADEPRPATRKGLPRSGMADWGSIDFPSLHDLSVSDPSPDPPRSSSPVASRPATRAPFRRHTVSSTTRPGSGSRLRTPSPPPPLPPLASTVAAVSMTRSASWRGALESPSSRDPRRPGAKTVRVGPIAGRVLFSDPNAPPLPPLPAHLVGKPVAPTRDKRSQSLFDPPRRPALPTSRSLFFPTTTPDHASIGGERMDRSASESFLMSPHRDGSAAAGTATTGSGPAFEALSPRRQFGKREEVRETGQWNRLNLDLAMVRPPARRREFDDEEVAQLRLLEGVRASRRMSRGWSMGSKGLGIAS